MAGKQEPLDLPDALVLSHRRYYGAAGQRWISGLPALAADCLNRWQLRRDGAGWYGSVALVLPVVRVDGTPAALKLQPVDDETRGEAAALRSWAGLGAVQLLEHDPATGSLLLERLDARRSLAGMGDALAAVEVIARLLRRFHDVPAPMGLRQLADLAEATLAGVPRLLRSVPDAAERSLLQVCAGRVRELLGEPVGNRLLHWDLHYANVLASLSGDGEPWRAIDPKPLAGDPGFELLPALWNRWEDVVAGGDAERAVLRRFDLMTDTMGLERERASAWTLGRVLQNASWEVSSGRQPALSPALRVIAEALLTRS